MITFITLHHLLSLFFCAHAFCKMCVCILRRQKRQRALNAASGTVATLTAGTLSAATLSLRHATGARIHSTAWTPSDHAQDKPRHQTSWSPAAAVMVGKKIESIVSSIHTELLVLVDCERLVTMATKSQFAG